MPKPYESHLVLDRMRREGWISLADEVRAIRFLLETGQAEGAYNLTGPEPKVVLENLTKPLVGGTQ